MERPSSVLSERDVDPHPSGSVAQTSFKSDFLCTIASIRIAYHPRCNILSDPLFFSSPGTNVRRSKILDFFFFGNLHCACVLAVQRRPARSEPLSWSYPNNEYNMMRQ
jgi:hypothetical protein